MFIYIDGLLVNFNLIKAFQLQDNKIVYFIDKEEPKNWMKKESYSHIYREYKTEKKAKKAFKKLRKKLKG